MPFSTETFIINSRVLPLPPPETVKSLPGQMTYIPGKTPNPEETILKLPIVGIGSTTPEFPTKPMIIKVISYDELDEATNTKIPKVIRIGIGSTGIIFREEVIGNKIKLTNDILGNVTGNVNAGIVTTTSISNGTNVLSFSVSGSNLTLTVTGVGSTTLKLA